MDELLRYSSKSFRAALGDALRARRGNEMGDVVKKEFYRDVAATGVCAEDTVAAYVKGQRQPPPKILEAMAAVLEIEPDYFIEYRVYVVQDILSRRPDLVGQTYESLVNHDRAEGHLEDQRKSRRRRSAASE